MRYVRKPELPTSLNPACVKACPTGALKWVDKEEAMKIAEGRVQYLGGDANIYGDKFVGGTHMMYVLKEKADVYDGMKKDPKVPILVTVWKSWLKPLSLLAAGGVIGGSFLHYIIHGPQRPHPEHMIKMTRSREVHNMKKELVNSYFRI